jgi:hypothetical protein
VTDAALPDLVLLDDALVPAEGAVVSAFDRGVMYGESLFETLKVIDGACGRRTGSGWPAGARSWVCPSTPIGSGTGSPVCCPAVPLRAGC